MNMKFLPALVAGFLALVPQSGLLAAEDPLILGFNIPQTGALEAIGISSKNAAELAREIIERQGGIKIGGKAYELICFYGDNASNRSTATTVATTQITLENVIAIIGPQSSNNAIPVGQVANSFKTPMISPWSTSPVTTKDRPYVFRIPFVVDKQTPVAAQFAKEEFGATKAAILFDVTSAYPRAMAKYMRDSFERLNGVGSVLAFEEFRNGDTDFSKQLERIKQSGAEVLFTPQYYNEVPLIVRQAKSLGLTIPIMGANAWAGSGLVEECGADCNGLYYTGNYAPGGATGVNKEFVDLYKKTYGTLPDEPAALTFDAVNVVAKALENTGGLSGDLMEDRNKLKDQLPLLKNFEGVTGSMSFNASGDPDKCVQVIKIDNGMLTHYKSVCP
jgi:branched-chain amino acid transport system substrate-binding protein